MPVAASSTVNLHPTYSTPIRPPAENVILRSEDGTGFYFDFRVLQSSSSFFKDISDVPQPSNSSPTIRTFPLASTTRALHVVRRMLEKDFFAPRFSFPANEYDNPDLGDLVVETLAFADAYDVPFVRETVAKHVTKEPFLHYALTLMVTPLKADLLVRNLVQTHNVGAMPAAALAVLSHFHPDILAALDRLYRIRRFEYNWDEVKSKILEMRIKVASFSEYRYSCSKHGGENLLDSAGYQALRPALVNNLSYPTDLDSEPALRTKIHKVMGCHRNACARPIMIALKRAKLPMPSTVQVLLDMEKKEAEAEERRKAKEKEKRDKARKRRRMEEEEDETEDENSEEDESDGD